MGTDLQEYQYTPLTSPKALRILKLRPAQVVPEPENDKDYDEISVDCDFIEVTPKDAQEYEALSWCWGTGKFDKILRLHIGDIAYWFAISLNLKQALLALRHEHKARYLWIDAICIDQSNTEERNEQVPRMDDIYGGATNVCIWLGKATPESKLALSFIRTKVLRLWEFDQLCEDLKAARLWAALITLMKRPWFSRRWVIQEISLARRGTVHCGSDEIDWKDFADAVSLFVEVESATKRLSEVMKRDQSFDHIPNFFGDVPSLGAALLVDATSNLFRTSKDGKRETLSNLEYLVSRLSVFESSQPRDTIYALLAIARDSNPQSGLRDQDLSSMTTIQRTLQRMKPRNIVSEQYNVDYKLPVVEVYKQFIAFSIRKSEQSRALDILCRPWAPSFRNREEWAFLTELHEGKLKPKCELHTDEENDHQVTLPSWIPGVGEAAFAMEEHPSAKLRMVRKNADPLVGMPSFAQRNYSAAGTRNVNRRRLRFKKRPGYYSMFVEGFVLDTIDKIEMSSQLGNIPSSWPQAVGWHDLRKMPPQDSWDEFWRTLVADRGPGGRNPPTFYPRACMESIRKMPLGGTLNTQQWVNEGRCTIVAEFLRRVQATIWNRRLMRTKRGHLGLVSKDARPGDRICVLYGCSVPVVLSMKTKSKAQLAQEKADDEADLNERVAAFARTIKANRDRRLREGRPLQKRAHAANGIWEVWDYVHLGCVCAMNLYLWYQQSQMLALLLVLTSVQTMSLFLPQQGYGRPSVKRTVRWLSKNRMGWLFVASTTLLLATSLTHTFVKAVQGMTLDTVVMSVAYVILFPQVWPPNLRSLFGIRYIQSAPTYLRVRTSRLWQQFRHGRSHQIAPSVQPTEDALEWCQLVGESYVHGMMNGEAIAWQNEHEVPPHTFEIR